MNKHHLKAKLLFALLIVLNVSVWAKAFQEGNDVIVYSESIAQPVAVRYDWGNTPDGNLYNRENLPAVPFRTDDW
jgi:sialate O-acetylesterase